MTTPNIRRRVSRQELAGMIATQLAENPGISIREISRRIRAAGVKASNDALRSLTRAIKVNPDLTVRPQDVLMRPASDFASPRQFAAALATVSERAIGDLKASHMQVAFEATAQVDAYLYGEYYGSATVVVRGVRVMPVRRYRPELLASHVAKVIEAAADDKFPEVEKYKLDIDIVERNVTITGVKLVGV